MMKQRCVNMSAILLLGVGVLYANDVSRSFLAIRPYAGQVMNQYQLLDQVYDNGRVLKMNSVQISLFGGSSFCADALARYFMFNGKSSLLVKNVADTDDAVVNAQDILAGVSNKNKFVVELDREKAIALAIQQASIDDWILIAGKGHETEQIIGTQVTHHSDVKCVQERLSC